MNKNIIHFCCAFALAIPAVARSAGRVDFSFRAMLAGKASLTESGYVVKRTVDIANFSPELRLAIELNVTDLAKKGRCNHAS